MSWDFPTSSWGFPTMSLCFPLVSGSELLSTWNLPFQLEGFSAELRIFPFYYFNLRFSHFSLDFSHLNYGFSGCNLSYSNFSYGVSHLVLVVFEFYLCIFQPNSLDFPIMLWLFQLQHRFSNSCHEVPPPQLGLSCLYLNPTPLEFPSLNLGLPHPTSYVSCHNLNFFVSNLSFPHHIVGFSNLNLGFPISYFWFLITVWVFPTLTWFFQSFHQVYSPSLYLDCLTSTWIPPFKFGSLIST